MQFHIEQNFLCLHCNEVVPVLFQRAEEVTVRATNISDENGMLAERTFRHATICGTCKTTFVAFIRVLFYCKGNQVTIYDSGDVVREEVGVEHMQSAMER